VLALGIYGAVSRLLLGVALLLAPLSPYFWGVVAVAIFFAVLSFVLIWRHTNRGVAVPQAWGRYMENAAMLYIPFVAAVHFVFFFGSSEVVGWFSPTWTLIAFAIADAVLLVIPGLVLITDTFYKDSTIWPLFPRFVYFDYHLDFYWQAEARPDLFAYHHGELAFVQARATTTSGAVDYGAETRVPSRSSPHAVKVLAEYLPCDLLTTLGKTL